MSYLAKIYQYYCTARCLPDRKTSYCSQLTLSITDNQLYILQPSPLRYSVLLCIPITIPFFQYHTTVLGSKLPFKIILLACEMWLISQQANVTIVTTRLLLSRSNIYCNCSCSHRSPSHSPEAVQANLPEKQQIRVQKTLILKQDGLDQGFYFTHLLTPIQDVDRSWLRRDSLSIDNEADYRAVKHPQLLTLLDLQISTVVLFYQDQHVL